MTPDELVDIVDEEGNFIEVVSKREAHEKGLLHKCVVAEIIDSRGRWLMVKQPTSKQDSGQYVSAVGGHVSAGETEVEALKKEAQEEIGLDGDFKYELVGRTVLNRYVLGRQENHLLVLYKIYSDKEPIVNDEVESHKYFTDEELKQELKENPKSFGNAFHFIVEEFFPDFK